MDNGEGLSEEWMDEWGVGVVVIVSRVSSTISNWRVKSANHIRTGGDFSMNLLYCLVRYENIRNGDDDGLIKLISFATSRCSCSLVLSNSSSRLVGLVSYASPTGLGFSLVSYSCSIWCSSTTMMLPFSSTIFLESNFLFLGGFYFGTNFLIF